MSIPTGFQDDRVAANDGLEQLVNRSWSVDDFDLVRFITIFQTENEVAIVGVLVIPLHAGFELDALGGPSARTGSWMCSTHRFQFTIWCFWPSPASFYNWEDDAENSPSIVMHRARASSKKRASALHTAVEVVVKDALSLGYCFLQIFWVSDHELHTLIFPVEHGSLSYSMCNTYSLCFTFLFTSFVFSFIFVTFFIYLGSKNYETTKECKNAE